MTGDENAIHFLKVARVLDPCGMSRSRIRVRGITRERDGYFVITLCVMVSSIVILKLEFYELLEASGMSRSRIGVRDITRSVMGTLSSRGAGWFWSLAYASGCQLSRLAV